MEVIKYDTIIVGGGIAGLTSAVYLARAGKKVLLIEKNKEPGGLVNAFTRNGFHFEAGVRALESAGVILPMLNDLGIQLEQVPSKVSIGIENRVLNIQDISSIEDYRNLLASLYPESKPEIDDFIRAMRKIMKHLDVLYGIENPVFKDLKNDKNYLFKKLLPWLPRFILTVGKINRLSMPIEDYLKNIITNPSLRDFISQHFFKATPAFFAMSYFSLYLDYFYPKGGVGKLADVLVDKIRFYEGSLQLQTTIKQVDAHEKYVVDEQGKQYHFNNLIWAADLKTFYQITLTQNLPAATINKFEAAKKQIMASKGSESVFSLYLMADLPLSYFQNIAHGHFFYTPSKIGLHQVHRSELNDLLKHWDKNNKPGVYSWFERFLNLNTFEISIPGLKDPSLVPENKTGLIVSFIIEYELFEKLYETGWYDEFRAFIENKMIDILSQSIYPKLKNSIEKQFSITPISIRKRTGSTDGAIVGWTFEKPLPVLHQIQKADKAVFTPIPGIYQAGQWAYSPAGVPMSILTGKIAADKILKQ